MVSAFYVQEELYRHYNWRSLKEYFFGKRVRLAPPEYNEAVVGNALPPTYEEALATLPPGSEQWYSRYRYKFLGYTPTYTPPVPNSRAECHIARFNSTRSTVYFTRIRVQSEREEEET